MAGELVSSSSKYLNVQGHYEANRKEEMHKNDYKKS